MNHCNTCKHLDVNRCRRLDRWKPDNTAGVWGARAEFVVTNPNTFGCTMHKSMVPPAPWRVFQNPETGQREIHSSDSIPIKLATIENGAGADDIARLMGASPRLRDALQKVFTWWTETTGFQNGEDEMPADVFDAMRFALAEVNGVEP